MAQRYDVSLKALFLREGDGIIRRRLFGGRVTEHLSTEQPQVLNNRADMVVRTEDGSLHHVEFQVANEVGFGRRMFGYYAYLLSAYDQHVVQTVLYLGGRNRCDWIPATAPLRWTFGLRLSTCVSLRPNDCLPVTIGPTSPWRCWPRATGKERWRWRWRDCA